MNIPKKIVIDFTNKPYDKMNTIELAKESDKIKNVYNFLKFYKDYILMEKSEKNSLINDRKGSLISQKGTNNILTIYSGDYLKDKEDENQYENLISINNGYDYESLFREVERMYIETSSIAIKQVANGEITFDMQSESYDENDVQDVRQGNISMTNSGFYIGAEGYGNHSEPLALFDYFVGYDTDSAVLKIAIFNDPHSEDPNQIINLENMKKENIKYDMEDILYDIITLPQEYPKYFNELLNSEDFQNVVDKKNQRKIVSQIIEVIKKNGIENLETPTSIKLLDIVDMYNSSEFINPRTNEMCKNTVDAIQSIFEKFEKTGKENKIEKTNHTIDN